MSGRVADSGALFPSHKIIRPKSISALGFVNSQNSADAQYYVDEKQRRWVGKPELTTGFQPVLAEAISWFLSREVGALTPAAGCFGEIGKDFVWLSEFVASGLHWEERYANFIANDGEVGAMLAVDAIVMNQDRHAQNVLVVPQQSETVLRVWSIDYGNALVGHIGDFCRMGSLDLPDCKKLIRKLPIPRLRTGATFAAQKMVDLANRSDFLPLYVQTACDLVHETENRTELLARLFERLLNAKTLVSGYLDLIESLP